MVETIMGKKADFNPRSPRGERPDSIDYRLADRAISIHAPREGSDSTLSQDVRGGRYFNPRSPRGERPSKSHADMSG